MIPIFDGHNDVLLDVYGAPGHTRRGFFERGERGHLDLPRAREGGFAGGFFAVWVPPDPAAKRPLLRPAAKPDRTDARPEAALDHSYAQRMALAMAGTLFRLERESEGQVRVVTDIAALRECLQAGTLAAVLHFEGAEAIDPQLNSLELFYRAGLRSLGLVWSRPNAFAEGVPFRFPSSPDIGGGLTEAGRELVRECNRLGIMLDLSHLNEKGFWEVAELSQAPLVATHSNAHALTPSARNLTDAQLDAIRASGGVVGVNYAAQFLRADGEHDPDTPLSEVVRHFDYLVDRLGVDHVAFGSDFDGATIPKDLGDAAGLPRLVAALEAAGLREPDLRKLGTENWLRLLEQTWKQPVPIG